MRLNKKTALTKMREMWYNITGEKVAMNTSNRKYKDSVFVDRQRLYIRAQSLTSSFEQSSKHRNAGTPAIRGGYIV